MKKVLTVALLCIVVCLFLSACQKSDPKRWREISAQPDVTADSVTEKTFTKEQVRFIFNNEKENSNRTITDCVVAEDRAYGLTGVVQFTKEDGNACYLAFVKDTWSYPIGLDADNRHVIADDSVLTYLGNGIVTLLLKDLLNEIVYDYTVAYSCNDSETNFRVLSAERK
ncbi:MAG TPA: hypothetical protein GXZ96_03335 [Firmicutes bacterium]|nr:hypothetical protein [Bacillota bacterium]